MGFVRRHRLVLELALLALVAYLAGVGVTTRLDTAVDERPPAPAEAAPAVAPPLPAPPRAPPPRRAALRPGRPRRRPHPPHRRERLHRGPARCRRRGRQRERPHDAAPRRGRGARGPPRGLPPLPDPRR